MNTNTKRNPIPMEEVMAWLNANHPNILGEPDRAWLWLIADLRGDHNKATRESLKAYGFRFAVGGHKLPSGQVSHWAHSCQQPKAFTRKSSAGGGGKSFPKGKASPQPKQKPMDNAQRVDPMDYQPPQMDEQKMAALAAAFA